MAINIAMVLRGVAIDIAVGLDGMVINKAAAELGALQWMKQWDLT